ncbi:hypothetical protein JCM31271_09950 [Halorubrum trueperi]
MARHKLIPYWVKVREFNEPNKRWNQTKIQEHEPKFPFNNLADYFQDFLEEYTGEENVHINEKRDKTFTVQRPVERSGNTIEGRFKSGEWGENADFWDKDKHERIKDARRENHAKEVPYYFLFHIPDHNPYQALLVLSRSKRKGIKSVLDDIIYPRKREMTVGDAYMDIKPHYSDKVLEEINNADSIASLKFRGQDVVAAREQYAERKSLERLNDDMEGVIDVGLEMKLTPDDNQGAFREFIRGLRPEEESPDFEYGHLETGDFSSASVTVVEGESQLTFPLWEDEVQMRMDVNPDDYDLDIYGGYPTPYSLGCVARQLANDLMDDLSTSIDTESLVSRSVGIPEDQDEELQPAPAED